MISDALGGRGWGQLIGDRQARRNEDLGKWKWSLARTLILVDGCGGEGGISAPGGWGTGIPLDRPKPHLYGQRKGLFIGC